MRGDFTFSFRFGPGARSRAGLAITPVEKWQNIKKEELNESWARKIKPMINVLGSLQSRICFLFSKIIPALIRSSVSTANDEMPITKPLKVILAFFRSGKSEIASLSFKDLRSPVTDKW